MVGCREKLVVSTQIDERVAYANTQIYTAAQVSVEQLPKLIGLVGQIDRSCRCRRRFFHFGDVERTRNSNVLKDVGYV